MWLSGLSSADLPVAPSVVLPQELSGHLHAPFGTNQKVKHAKRAVLVDLVPCNVRQSILPTSVPARLVLSTSPTGTVTFALSEDEHFDRASLAVVGVAPIERGLPGRNARWRTGRLMGHTWRTSLACFTSCSSPTAACFQPRFAG